MPFTFYGDLLGIFSAYKLSPEAAYQTLNNFYNTVFSTLDDHWERENNIRTLMFSDSLLITGRANYTTALEQISRIYVKVLEKGLMLRGAIVAGELKFEPRIDRSSFQKMLPRDDTLARAAGLEGTQKGARLLIEPALARSILESEQQWLTQEGYVCNVRGNANVDLGSILRRISPTPDGSGFELLYFWSNDVEHSDRSTEYKTKRSELRELQKIVRKDIAVHYKETLALLDRCASRQRFTEKHRI